MPALIEELHRTGAIVPTGRCDTMEVEGQCSLRCPGTDGACQCIMELRRAVLPSKVNHLQNNQETISNHLHPSPKQ